MCAAYYEFHGKICNLLNIRIKYNEFIIPDVLDIMNTKPQEYPV